MGDLHLIPTGYERRLPPSVQMVVRGRRRALTRSLTGRVLDLGGAEAHRSLWRRDDVDVTILDGVEDPALLECVDRGDEFDEVVSVLQLTTTSDVASALSRIHRLVGETGRLRFLEPSTRAGGLGRLQRLAAPMVTMSTGIRLDRDVPSQLRKADLAVTTIERHRPPTTQWWFREFVEGTAHRSLL